MSLLCRTAMYSTRMTQLGVPSYMSYTVPFNIYLNAATGVYATDFSVNWSETAQYTWYVNGVTGSDTNDGLTPETAFKSISKAILKTGSGIHFIYVEGNQEYTYDIGWGANVAPAAHTKTYVQARNGRVICGARIATPTWTNTVGNEWKFVKGTGVTAYSGMVRDKKYPVKDLAAKYYQSYETAGDDVIYTLGTLGSLVAGQYAISTTTNANDTITVRCSDNRQPDSDITVELSLNGGKHGFGDLYVSGFDFSGNVPFNLQMGTSTQTTVLEDCTFKYGWQSASTNTFVYTGTGVCILNRCAAALGKADNFNYHTTNDTFTGTGSSQTVTLSFTSAATVEVSGVPTTSFTQVGNQLTITAPAVANNIFAYPTDSGARSFGIDCVSRKAGVASATNNNCNTHHESLRGAWVNLNCYGATGPTINNINATQISYYGGSADGCSAASGNNAFNAGAQGFGKMLLHGMVVAPATNGGYRSTIGTGGTLYNYNSTVTPTLGGGTVTAVNINGEVA
jgi:hypothetical protein